MPPLTAEETKRLETEGEISYVILAAAILGLLLLMGFMAGMVAFAVWYVSTRDRVSFEFWRERRGKGRIETDELLFLAFVRTVH